MMNYRKLAFCVLLFVLFSFGLNAEEINDKIDKARLGLAQSLINASDYEQAMPIIQQLYEKYPNNEDVVAQYALVLADKQQYSQAIELCQQYLKNNKEHKTIKLWLARFLSWDQQYSEATELYSGLIFEYPEWLAPAREKARVLGWDRKYDEAIEEYRKVVHSNPNHPEIRYEMLAKYDLYNQFDISAIENYKHWLQIEPKDLEALYDLGQVYSRQSKWVDANQMYERVLDVYPNHFRAKQALDKIKIYSGQPKLTTGFEFFEADSSSRTMDKRYWNTFTSILKPLNENYYLRLRQDNIWYNFKNFSQIYQQRLSVGLDYYSKPEFWASVDYAHSIYPEENGVRHTFGSQINYLPYDPLTLTLSHQREQIVDNSTTFRSQLCRDNYSIKGLYRLNRRFSASFDYMYSHYSDDNSRNAYGLDIDYYLSFEPRSLKISYRYEGYQFAREDVDYFSPGSFHYNKVALEWRHFLNKEELFWGANDTYYTLRYEMNFDVKRENGHKLSIDFHHDWSNNCSSRLEWSKTIYEHSDTYSENRLMFYTSIYF
jgi:tetratricopeptide (TPR) repeat protein